MPLSEAERQRRRRARLKEQGLVHLQGWVTPDQAAAINAIIEGRQAAWSPSPEGAADPKPSATDAPVRAALELEGAGRVLDAEPVTGHRPSTEKPDKGPPTTLRIGRRTTARCKSQAANHAPHGLTSILEHFQRTSRHEGFTYARSASLLSEEDYRLACRAEARRMSGQGLSWTAVAREFNSRAIPLPAPAKGKWSGPKLRALVSE
jgi:hypothetical protein